MANEGSGPFFTRMHGLELLVDVFVDAYMNWSTERIAHHEKHGNKEDLRIFPVIMSFNEARALLEHFKPMLESEEGIPDALCPLLSELHHTLEHSVAIMPINESGNPNLN